MSESHLSFGSEEEIQRAERGFGFGMTRSRLLRSRGAAVAMYLLWKATPELLTRRANTPSAVSSSTKRSTDGTGPDTVTLSAALWQAGTTSGGQRSTHCSHESPTAAMPPGASFASTMLRPRQYAHSTACSPVSVSSA